MASADVEVEAIGAHCQTAYCHRLDFLPFRCESCRGTFCLDHRTETAHDCPHLGAWAARRARQQAGGGASAGSGSGSTTATATGTGTTLLQQQQAQQLPRPCAAASCQTTIDSGRSPGIHCSSCNRRYCLKHRFADDHDCSKLVPRGARPSSSTTATTTPAKNFQAGVDKARLALSKLTASWAATTITTTTTTTTPKSKSKSKSKPSALTSLNELKRTAQGDANLPADRRIYLYVEGERERERAAAITTTNDATHHPRLPLFFDRAWSVGRMLDAAAARLQMANVNNRGGGEAARLRLFHVERGRVLPFAARLGGEDEDAAGLRTGDTVVLLRGVGGEVEG
ncbi:MAG: hypothetical protein M1826_006010 [Phylliscum demangeonii]|nr:MAG: hypothetical protein M1826_006010 [Phylliscum demangeonii]